MPNARLPAHLAERPFTLGEARAVGVSDGGLRRSGLHRVTHGVHARLAPEGLTAQLAALLLGLPADVALSHRTAARLHDLPLTGRQTAINDHHVMCRTGAGPIRRPGVLGHRGLETRTVVQREGLPVTSATDTWLDFGELVRRDLLTVDDLVVVGDAAANVVLRPEHTAYDFSDVRPQWWVTTTVQDRLLERDQALQGVREVLRGSLESRVRPRGKRALTEALPLIRPGVRSPMESRARLVFVHHGLPEPHVNLDIYTEDGQWLAEGDLVWVGQKVVGEYQGAHHADRARASKDSDKKARLRDHGWRTREIWAEDLFEWERRKALLTRFAALLN